MAAGAADARALKWARTGDALTLDPHAQNEGPTHNLMQQIYEPLLIRDATRQGAADAGAVMGGDERPDGVGVQAAPGREVPQRQRLHCRRCRVLAGARAAADIGHEGAAELDREGEQGRRLTVHIKTKGPNPLLPNYLTNMFIMDKEWSEANNTVTVQDYKEQEGQLRGPQRQRHRALRARVARAGRQDRAEAQRWLLGQGRVAAGHHRDHLSDDQVRRHARRGAARRARSISCRTCPCRTSTGWRRPPNLKVNLGPENRTIFFGMDVGLAGAARPPTSRARTRSPTSACGRRCNMAIDREAIKRAVMRGQSVPAGVDRAAVRQRLHQGARRIAQGRSGQPPRRC